MSIPLPSTEITPADLDPFDGSVSVGIVTHNGLTKLSRSLEAFARCGCPAERITVVDVASDDGTGEWLRTKWPNVEFIRLPENRGPNPARNLLLRRADTPFVLLMDDDVEVRHDTIDALYRAIRDDPSIVVACPIAVYGDRPDIVNYSCGPLHYLVEAIDPYQGRALSEVPPGHREAVVMVGCALLIRRQAVSAALMFDERLFFGRTDGDFAYRLALAGRRSVAVGDAVVLHHTRPRGSKMLRHQLANSWHMMLKSYQLSTMLVIAPMMALHVGTQLLAVAKQGQIRAFSQAIQDVAARLSTLSADRAAIAATRRRFDVELLSGEPFVVPKDLLAGRVVPRIVAAYQRLLRAYWVGARVILRACGQRPERDSVRQQSVSEWLDFSRYVTEYRFSSYWHQLDWVFRTAPREVLEIGVGPGLVALYLRAKGIRVCTVDMEHALHPDVCGSVTNLPFSDRTFDVILCCQVLEHLPFDMFDQCLRELRRVCCKRLILSLPDKTPGLAMSIRVPNFLFWEFCLSLPAAIREPIRRVREHHWEIGRWGYSSRRITKRLENAGFSLDRTYRVPAYPYHRFFILTPR